MSEEQKKKKTPGDSKNKHAIGWGIGGGIGSISGGAIMIFGGPLGWFAGGIILGLSSSMSISAAQQGLDSSQKEFSYTRLGVDVAIGTVVSAATCGIGAAGAAASVSGKVAVQEAAKVAVD